MARYREADQEALAIPPMSAPREALPTNPVLLMTFDRWFALSGRKSAHKPGMRAYADVRGRRTRVAWDAMFKHY